MTPEQTRIRAQVDQWTAEANREVIPQLVEFLRRGHKLHNAYGDSRDPAVTDTVEFELQDGDPEVTITQVVEALSEIANAFHRDSPERIVAKLREIAGTFGVEVDA